MTEPTRISPMRAALLIGSAIASMRKAKHVHCQNSLSIHESLLKGLDQLADQHAEDARREDRR